MLATSLTRESLRSHSPTKPIAIPPIRDLMRTRIRQSRGLEESFRNDRISDRRDNNDEHTTDPAEPRIAATSPVNFRNNPGSSPGGGGHSFGNVENQEPGPKLGLRYGNKYPHISTNWDTKHNHNHPDRKTHVTKKDRCLVYDSDNAAAQYLYHLLPRSGAVPSRPSCTPSHHRTMPEASKALPIKLQHPLFVNKHITEVEAGHRLGPFYLDETHIVSMGISESIQEGRKDIPMNKGSIQMIPRPFWVGHRWSSNSRRPVCGQHVMSEWTCDLRERAHVQMDLQRCAQFRRLPHPLVFGMDGRTTSPPGTQAACLGIWKTFRIHQSPCVMIPQPDLRLIFRTPLTFYAQPRLVLRQQRARISGKHSGIDSPTHPHTSAAQPFTSELATMQIMHYV
ncbi:hypothetical protein JB92DRAFT_3104556 [Gautieria morchelliformis]|nr:hypothetical protein JB92DRAFT_3104556 [Gautieria morchelliformis]